MNDSANMGGSKGGDAEMRGEWENERMGMSDDGK